MRKRTREYASFQMLVMYICYFSLSLVVTLTVLGDYRLALTSP